MPEVKKACWRSKEAFMQCIMKTKCYKEKKDIEACLTVQECFLERKNWVICRMNSHNPKYRMRGNPYDKVTTDQKKTDERVDRIKRHVAEESGLVDSKE